MALTLPAWDWLPQRSSGVPRPTGESPNQDAELSRFSWPPLRW